LRCFFRDEFKFGSILRYSPIQAGEFFCGIIHFPLFDGQVRIFQTERLGDGNPGGCCDTGEGTCHSFEIPSAFSTSSILGIASSSSVPSAAIVTIDPEEMPSDMTPRIDFKFTCLPLKPSVMSDWNFEMDPTSADAGRAWMPASSVIVYCFSTMLNSS